MRRDLLGRMANAIDPWSRIISYVLTGITFLSLVANALFMVKDPISEFVVSDLKRSFIILLFAWTLSLTVYLTRLSRRFAMGFTDKFTQCLDQTWDFSGGWKRLDDNTLVVTNSDHGGITKVGSLWENYIFQCRFKIINKCIGVIVRAKDIHNYYMFQINTDNIHPHRKWGSPVFKPQDSESNSDAKMIVQDFERLMIAWQLRDPPTPVDIKPHTWHRLRIEVRGSSVTIFIDGERVLQRDNFLDITMGRIGFRNAGSEEAYVRDVRVRVIP